MQDYYDSWCRRRDMDLQDVQEFAARFAENTWRIAAVLHGAKYVNIADKNKVSIETIREAIKISDWFVRQLLAMLSGGREDAMDSKILNLAAYLKKKNKSGEMLLRNLLKNRGWQREYVDSVVQESKGHFGNLHKDPRWEVCRVY
jgi:hypothetical protein